MATEDDVRALQTSFADLLRRHELLTAQFRQAAETINPIGTIISFGGAREEAMVGAGWLICNGAEVASADYPELARALGTSWGEAAAGMVRLPNLDGLFLRGLDHGTGRDTARAVGSVQEDAMQSHTHRDAGHIHTYHTPERTRDDDQADDEHSVWSTDTSGDYGTGVGHAALGEPEASSAGAPRHGSENRPKNAAVAFYVRAKVVPA